MASRTTWLFGMEWRSATLFSRPTVSGGSENVTFTRAILWPYYHTGPAEAPWTECPVLANDLLGEQCRRKSAVPASLGACIRDSWSASALGEEPEELQPQFGLQEQPVSLPTPPASATEKRLQCLSYRGECRLTCSRGFLSFSLTGRHDPLNPLRSIWMTSASPTLTSEGQSLYALIGQGPHQREFSCARTG